MTEQGKPPEAPESTPAPQSTSAPQEVQGQVTSQDQSKWASRKLLVLCGCFAICFANAFLENPIDPDVLNTLLYTAIGYLVSQGYVDGKGMGKGMLGAMSAFSANAGQSAGMAHRGEQAKPVVKPVNSTHLGP